MQAARADPTAPGRLPQVPDAHRAGVRMGQPARGSALLRVRELGTVPRAGTRTCVYPDVPRQLAWLLEGLPTVRAGIREPTPVHVAVVGPRAGHPSATWCPLSSWCHPSRGPLHTSSWLAVRAGSSENPPPQVVSVRLCPLHTHTHTSFTYTVSQKSTFSLSNEKTDVVCFSLCFGGGWHVPPCGAKHQGLCRSDATLP